MHHCSFQRTNCGRRIQILEKSTNTARWKVKVLCWKSYLSIDKGPLSAKFIYSKNSARTGIFLHLGSLHFESVTHSLTNDWKSVQDLLLSASTPSFSLLSFHHQCLLHLFVCLFLLLCLHQEYWATWILLIFEDNRFNMLTLFNYLLG